jgi:hypothetical protein
MPLRRRSLFLLLFFFGGCIGTLLAEDPCGDSRLMNDLLIVDYWNQRINDRLPVTYNHLLQGGYFAMPSARMGCEGEVGIGYSYVPPYRNYNLRCQILSHLEITGNYRVFHGIKDPVLSPHGFGDFSDKGANFKYAIFLPEDSDYVLPGIAIGLEDFIGTQAFHDRYIVFTQVFLKQNLEISLGLGAGRIKGLFGGFNWLPFRQCGLPFLRSFSLSAEYDATQYHKEKREPHPKGREQKSPINFGIKYRLWDTFDLSLSYIRGKEVAFAASTYYNFGETKGFLPKIDDALPYRAPVNFEPLGVRRPEETLSPELLFAFREQNLDLLDVYLYYNDCNQKVLRLKVLNETYRQENELRCQLNDLLIVVIESEGFPIQEYHYYMEYLRAYGANEMGPFELSILTPLTEVTYPAPYTYSHLFSRKRDLYNFEITPNTHTLFGSSSGKFKYTLGLHFAFNGFLWKDVYYNILIGYTAATNIGTPNPYDLLNPSQLINVRTDIVRYYKRRGFSLDQAFLQKNWNMGRGWYARIAGGYFEEEYAGLAGEALYYPLDCPLAFGIEGAILKKRTYTGLGFTSTVTKYHGYTPTFVNFPYGTQYFASIYYDCKPAHLEFKISAGKFLANDWGVRNEISRYFPSGMRITIWYTLTNGHDKINGKTYYDKGVAFTMPFDIFYTYSERSKWNYGMSAWLRDVGVQADTGLHLYEMINDQRQNFYRYCR